MDKRILQGTCLKVSRVCFGTMTFGGQTDEPAAQRMIDSCLDAGINFLDTANAYNGGASEQILGRCIQGKRDRVVLATKVRNKMGEGAGMNGDRKSTRLNSSHQIISYAVFCLKKKKKPQQPVKLGPPLVPP